MARTPQPEPPLPDDNDEYLAYFNLRREPFSTTPDPKMAFASQQHKDAIAKIAFYTRRKRGIYLVRGEVGTGKTTLAQLALSGWRKEPDKFIAAHITDPSPRTEPAFLRLVLASLGQKTPRNLLDLKATLRNFLVEQAQAKRVIALLIDEAQKIYPTNLDTLHNISNEQTSTAKLIQICLFATNNFDNKLAQHKPLRSRIAGGMTLNPFTPEETLEMLRHRMTQAGGDFDILFPPATHDAIYAATDGVPRDLCVLCDACLVETMLRGKRVVDQKVLDAALHDLSFKEWGIK